MSEPNERTSPPPQECAAKLFDEQRRRWRQGERVLVEAFLKQLPALSSDRNTILDLIYNEIVLREEHGERPELHEYVQRFPRLSEELTLQFEVERALDWELFAAARMPGPSADLASTFVPVGGTSFPPLPGYEVVGVLGRGRTGVVYQARHLRSNRMDSVKVILTGVPESSALASFRAEFERLACLQHPGIVQVYEIGVHEGRLFIARELLHESLAERMAKPPPVSSRQAAQWTETLARTIHDVHRHGIVHQRLTLTNTLLNRGGAVKIADFGLAAMATGNANPAPGPSPRGRGKTESPSWLPAEETETEMTSAAADVYALGAILVELLTGQPPGSNAFEEGPPLARLLSKLPRDLETICLRCLHQDPHQRYAGAEALADDLSAFLAGKPVHSGRTLRRASWWLGSTELACVGVSVIALVGMGLGILGAPALGVGACTLLGLVVGYWCAHVRSRGQLREMTYQLSEATRQRTLAVRNVEHLQLLIELTRRLARTAHSENALPLIVETVLWLVDAEWCAVYHFDRDRDELWSERTGPEGSEETRLPVGAGITGQAAKTGEPINLLDVNADARFNPEFDGLRGTTTRNLLALPVVNPAGAVVGVFQIVNKRAGSFNDNDIEILSALLGTISMALDQAVAVRSQKSHPATSDL